MQLTAEVVLRELAKMSSHASFASLSHRTVDCSHTHYLYELKDVLLHHVSTTHR